MFSTVQMYRDRNDSNGQISRLLSSLVENLAKDSKFISFINHITFFL